MNNNLNHRRLDLFPDIAEDGGQILGMGDLLLARLILAQSPMALNGIDAKERPGGSAGDQQYGERFFHRFHRVHYDDSSKY